MLSNTLLSLFLLGVSAALILQHIRARKAGSLQKTDELARQFARSQYRRRMRASTLVGIVGIAVFVGHWVSEPVLALMYWGIILLVVMWILLLAVLDLLSSRAYFGRLQREQLVEEACLRADLRRAKSVRDNGDPRET